MSHRTETLIKWIGVALTILTFLATATASARSAFRGALGTKVDTAAYSRNEALRAVRDSIEHETVLDILCSPHVDPANRKCRSRR